MMIGLIFTLVPPLPGTLVMWGAAIFYGLVLGWEKLGWGTFALLTFFMLLGIAADGLAGHFGAKIGGASCLGVALGAIFGLMLGIVASFLGTPILGCLAGLIGTVGGVLLVEMFRNGNWRAAIGATKGYVAGTALGVMAKVTSGFFMVVIFLANVYWLD
jgi:hypothetical protein